MRTRRANSWHEAAGRILRSCPVPIAPKKSLVFAFRSSNALLFQLRIARLIALPGRFSAWKILGSLKAGLRWPNPAEPPEASTLD